jgi:hypothetical protein
LKSPNDPPGSIVFPISAGSIKGEKNSGQAALGRPIIFFKVKNIGERQDLVGWEFAWSVRFQCRLRAWLKFFGGTVASTRVAIFNTKKGEANEPEHSPGKKIEN